MGERKRQLREEVAELAQAVRELREQLALQHCHGCGCWHRPYVYPYQVTWTQPYTQTIVAGGGDGGAGYLGGSG